MRIDATQDADMPAILGIFNREIRDGVALWNTSERSAAEMAAWRAERVAGGFPVLSAYDEGGRMLGYGSFGPFRPHDGYARTVEHSLYVEPFAQGRGVGRALLARLVEEAQAMGKHAMIGGIEAGNAPSIGLHRSLGFEETARLPEVGRKFDRWLTLVLMQKLLA